MRALLTGQSGDLPVPAGSSILGRSPDCALRIDDPRLSRHHARLLHDGSTLVIEDLGSTNGVLVNNERIEGKRRLVTGDTVVCGPCVFTVVLDPTQKASASELVPSTDRKPDPTRTETMDPLELPGSDRVPATKPGRQLSPMIAAALSGGNDADASVAADAPAHRQGSSNVLKPEALRSDVSSDVLKPAEEPKIRTDPLIHRSDTTPRGNPIPAPSEIAERRDLTRDRKDKTTGLIPADFTQRESAALQPDFVTSTAGGPAPAGKRLVGAIADSATTIVLALALALPVIIGGYVWALAQAGAVIEQGLPTLAATPGHAATGAVIVSVFQPGGVMRAGELAAKLMQADDQQPFLILFAASALGVLFAVVAVLIYLVGGTVVRGAPYWHRRLGIEIVEHRTGYQVTWTRGVVRWLVFAVLWPLAPLALALDRRALHDVLVGCAVRSKRR